MLNLLLTETFMASDVISATISGVSAIGFPAFMCIIMLKYMKDSDEQNRAEIKALAKSLENNSMAITKLIEKIDNLKDKIGDN